jgi:hypothetical protein
LLALHLTENPGDIAVINQMLNRQHEVEMENQLKLLKIMLEEDAIEGYQLDEVRKRVLHKLIDNLGTKLIEDKGVKVADKDELNFQENHLIEDAIEIIDGEGITIEENSNDSFDDSIEIEDTLEEEDQ